MEVTELCSQSKKEGETSERQEVPYPRGETERCFNKNNIFLTILHRISILQCV